MPNSLLALREHQPQCGNLHSPQFIEIPHSKSKEVKGPLRRSHSMNELPVDQVVAPVARRVFLDLSMPRTPSQPFWVQSPEFADWNARSAWFCFGMRTSLASGTPIPLSYADDQTGYSWLALLRQTAFWASSRCSVPKIGNTTNANWGLSELMREHIALAHPALIPLCTTTQCDVIGFDEQQYYAQEFINQLSFSVEGWLNYRKHLDRRVRRAITPILLKIKICHLLRHLQMQIDREGAPNYKKLFQSHFNNIFDITTNIYSDKIPSHKCYRLNHILLEFCRLYQKNEQLKITDLQHSIDGYVTYAHSTL